MTCLIFNTEAEFNIANSQIWLNMINDIPNIYHNYDGYLWDVLAKEKVPFDSLSDAEKKDSARFPRLGICCGKIYKTDGYTTAWSSPVQRITDNKYWMEKPETKYMTGVTDYTEDQYSKTWVPESSE